MEQHTDLQEIIEYLNPAELDYQDWVNVGMALKHEGYSVDVWDTFDRMAEGSWPVQAKTALCEMCDCAYRYDRRDGKTSENNDGYSVSYDMNKTLNVMLYEIAEVYLINTGLLSLAVDDDVNECNDNCL